MAPRADASGCGRRAVPRCAAAPIGTVTSGGFAISLGVPIAMGYVPSEAAKAGTELFAELRGARQAMQVCDLPFVPLSYKR